MEIEFDKKPPYWQLDEVLKALIKCSPDNYYLTSQKLQMYFHHLNYRVNEMQIRSVLEELIDDKYVVRGSMENTESKNAGVIPNVQDYYVITFKGKAFLQAKSGYTGLAEMEERSEKSIQDEKQNLLNWQNESKKQSDKMAELQSRIISLTRWVVIGTMVAAAYYLNELCRYYHLFSFCSCQ